MSPMTMRTVLRYQKEKRQYKETMIYRKLKRLGNSSALEICFIHYGGQLYW